MTQEAAGSIVNIVTLFNDAQVAGSKRRFENTDGSFIFSVRLSATSVASRSSVLSGKAIGLADGCTLAAEKNSQL